MGVTRRQFLGLAAAGAFAGAWPYHLVDAEAAAAGRPGRGPGPSGTSRRVTALPDEQHLVVGASTVVDNRVPVTVPPLHHAVVTATLEVAPTPAALRQAQSLLETTLSGLEASGLLDFRPSGLALTVAWGTSYFARLPADLTASHLPVDLVTSAATGTPTGALVDAVRFASDPAGTVLEANDLALVLSSDHLDHIATALDAVVNGPAGGLLRVTSIRRGFVDARHLGSSRRSLTKRMAVRAHVPGAASIPDTAQLFLGFTSTQTAALGPSTIANLETLPGVTDQWPGGYFRHGTTMHLSHLHEDLEAWYSVSHAQRATFAVTPGIRPPGSVQTISQGPDKVESLDAVRADFARYKFVGHSASMHPESRLGTAVVDNYGTTLAAGTAIPQRADFNTLDNPFSYSADPVGDGMAPGPAAGVHFLAFLPTSSAFHRLRRAMDGQYGPDGDLGFEAVHGPFNNMLHTSHRQNYLVPPRVHRSFPLAELLA